MSFTIASNNHQAVDDTAGPENSEEVMLFGRALEIDDFDLIYHRQLSLPLIFTNEPVRYVQ